MNFPSRKWLLIGLLAISPVLGIVLYSTLIRPHLLPATIAYSQYKGPDPCHEDYCTTWAELNHTIVVQRNQVDSFLTVTVAEEPPQPVVFINISFDGGFEPVLTQGITQWTGEPHQGDSITIHTTISLTRDGLYYIWANPYSDSLGLVTVYRLHVESGIVVNVSNNAEDARGPPPPLEHRCLANCWP